MENIVENNKLLAQFLGGYEPEEYEDFHSDWNWLMEVVEKIEGLEEVDDFRIEISQVRIIASTSNEDFYGKVEYSNKGRFIDTEKGLITKIEATYIACVQFVKWYNQTKGGN